MKKAAMAFAAAFGALAAFGSTASQAWVEHYVSNRVSEVEKRLALRTGGGISTLTVPTAGGIVSNVVEEATVGGLVIGEATPLAVQDGITNGMLFAWNEVYNAYANGGRLIVATKTNLVYSVYHTAYLDAQTWLVDSQTNRFCRLYSTLIQPSVAAQILGGE